MQKAFIQGINGCIEHTQVMQELIRHAKSNNKTLHVTWFDLADAFGSVQHSLIFHELERNKFPPVIQQYVRTLYGNLTGYVKGPTWESNIFKFKKGVFQGDPLSPIIFLLAFNPILKYLKLEEKHGYELNGIRYISTPFADDFNLITTNKATHQRIMTNLQAKTKSMGLVLKPVKCKSLSLKSGKPTEITFKLGDFNVPTIRDEPHSFFGSIITFDGKSQDTFQHIRNKLSSGLNMIDKSHIRNEYKIKVYRDYFLPSLRFSLTVHEITKTNVNTLNQISNNYLKTWCGLPKCATNAVINMPQGLGIKSLDHLYKECHSTMYASSMIKADFKVKNCLNEKRMREQSWKHKFSVINYAHNLLESTQKQNPQLSNSSKSLKIIKSQIKKSIAQEIQDSWESKVKTLVLQGNMLSLMAEEKSNITWKSIIYNLPRKVLKFGLNSIVQTLPVNSNLSLWGKTMNQLCSLCGRKETVLHVLNGCPIMLNQGRYTYRHNLVLAHILKQLSEMYSSEQDCKIYSDIEGKHATGGGTIPPDILVTNEKPDIVITKPGKIELIELSIPFETNIQIRHNFKCDKYALLERDLKNCGLEVSLHAVEVGSRGYISPDNKHRLKEIFSHFNERQLKHLNQDLAQKAITASFAIFFSKYSTEWSSNNDL